MNVWHTSWLCAYVFQIFKITSDIDCLACLIIFIGIIRIFLKFNASRQGTNFFLAVVLENSFIIIYKYHTREEKYNSETFCVVYNMGHILFLKSVFHYKIVINQT